MRKGLGTGNSKLATGRCSLKESGIAAGARSRQLKVGGVAGSGKQLNGGAEKWKLGGVEIRN